MILLRVSVSKFYVLFLITMSGLLATTSPICFYPSIP